MEFTVAFTPLANTKHRTLSSARFYTDTQERHQALVIGTGRESPNALAYLGFPGFVERELSASDERGVESVAVSALALGSETQLFCFANRDDQNHCELMKLDSSLSRDNKVIGDAEKLSVTQGAGRRMDTCRYNVTRITESGESVPYDFGTVLTPTPSNEVYNRRGGMQIPSTPEDCQLRCDSKSGCTYALYISGTCAVRLKDAVRVEALAVQPAERYQCWMYTSKYEDEKDYDSIEGDTGDKSYMCEIGDLSEGYTTALLMERTCPNEDDGGASKSGSGQRFYFGDRNADTAHVRAAYLDDDAYPEVIVASARDNLQVYRGTQASTTTGDFSSIVPETVHASSLQDFATPRPPPPPPPGASTRNTLRKTRP
jgi:hypothetical protein